MGARAPNTMGFLLCFMTCFAVNSFPSLQPRPISAFASGFDQLLFYQAFPTCQQQEHSAFRHVRGAQGPGLPWLLWAAWDSTETLSPVVALGRDVHRQPCCCHPLSHPEPSPPR